MSVSSVQIKQHILWFEVAALHITASTCTCLACFTTYDYDHARIWQRAYIFNKITLHTYINKESGIKFTSQKQHTLCVNDIVYERFKSQRRYIWDNAVVVVVVAWSDTNDPHILHEYHMRK